MHGITLISSTLRVGCTIINSVLGFYVAAKTTEIYASTWPIIILEMCKLYLIYNMLKYIIYAVILMLLQLK